ncbi:UPF0103-domain-containing protein [Imleria badia]|nr:UPF0103-domain-containing protein [Imleria badia]
MQSTLLHFFRRPAPSLSPQKNMSSTRQVPAEHAGSWYERDAQVLGEQLGGWLAAVQSTNEQDFTPPIAGCRAIIAPHAGYMWSGRAAAWAYRCIDTTGIKRVFILGPAHHIHLNRCDVSGCDYYATPLGKLRLDKERDLKSTGKFGTMTIGTDKDEHSIEMHLPYVYQIFKDSDITVVPILVGSINHSQQKTYGSILAPYFADPQNFFVISSDFCHWGRSYGYTFYYPEPLPSDVPGIYLKSHGAHQNLSERQIHDSIRDLDQEALDILTLSPLSEGDSHAADSHEKFLEYLDRTGNTICGRKPIGVLLGMLSEIEKEGKKAKLQFVRYEQSTKCTSVTSSSVSYASAYVSFP